MQKIERVSFLFHFLLNVAVWDQGRFRNTRYCLLLTSNNSSIDKPTACSRNRAVSSATQSNIPRQAYFDSRLVNQVQEDTNHILPQEYSNITNYEITWLCYAGHVPSYTTFDRVANDRVQIHSYYHNLQNVGCSRFREQPVKFIYICRTAVWICFTNSEEQLFVTARVRYTCLDCSEQTHVSGLFGADSRVWIVRSRYTCLDCSEQIHLLQLFGRMLRR
jgi:DNA-directed RNA polymerase subunit RPC12/RpoP